MYTDVAAGCIQCASCSHMQGAGGGKAGRQNPKSKITSLNSQLAELEAELAAVERDCAQLEEENRALLEQAQEREAEVERERAKIARTMPTATATGSVGAQATQVRNRIAAAARKGTLPADTTFSSSLLYKVSHREREARRSGQAVHSQMIRNLCLMARAGVAESDSAALQMNWKSSLTDPCTKQYSRCSTDQAIGRPEQTRLARD